MSELEDKLTSLLSNPQLMQQVMSLAQNLGPSPPDPPKESPVSGFDPSLLQSLGAMASSGRIDGNQQALLHALCPYLSQNRVEKLERAMRAARLAGAASAFLNGGGLQMLTGR